MKILWRIVLVSAGAALVAALFVTRRGQEIRATLTDAGRSLLEATGLAAGSGGVEAYGPDSDLQARIEETRRRLKEQLAEDTTQET